MGQHLGTQEPVDSRGDGGSGGVRGGGVVAAEVSLDREDMPERVRRMFRFLILPGWEYAAFDADELIELARQQRVTLIGWHERAATGRLIGITAVRFIVTNGGTTLEILAAASERGRVWSRDVFPALKRWASFRGAEAIQAVSPRRIDRLMADAKPVAAVYRVEI